MKDIVEEVFDPEGNRTGFRVPFTEHIWAEIKERGDHEGILPSIVKLTFEHGLTQNSMELTVPQVYNTIKTLLEALEQL